MGLINILIVDDEPVGADGLGHYLEECGSTDWNIRVAYSGEEALQKVHERVDVLIADIVMPGIDGFQLQEKILTFWPMAKVIFLTGNPMLNHAQRAIRSGATTDYVLKTEDENIVLHAVKKAVVTIQSELRAQDVLSNAELQIQQALPLLRNDLFSRILRRGADPAWMLNMRFRQLELKLRADRPVLMLLGRLGITNQGKYDLDLAVFSLDNIFDKYMSPLFIWHAIRIQENRVVYFMQAQRDANAQTIEYAFSALEAMQQAYIVMVGPAAFVLDNRFVDWSGCAQRYRALAQTMERDIAPQEDALMLHSDRQMPIEEAPHDTLDALRDYFLQGQFNKAAESIQSMEAPSTAAGRIDLYRRMIKLFALVIEAREDAGELLTEIVFPAPRLDEEGWSRTQAEFAHVALRLSQNVQGEAEKLKQLAERVQKYVDEHLADDLSLTTMASLTYYSPTYFTKLFKKAIGIGYGEYVVNRRITAAARMLIGSQDKVNEIAQRVGYSSVSYFIRAFRIQYGVTPVEYRKVHVG